MTDEQSAATLPWIFRLAKCLGVGEYHIHWAHLLYGIALQIINVISLVVWVQSKNVFFEKSIYGFAWGVLHAVTTLTACVSAFVTWKNHEKLESALQLLGSCLKSDKSASFVWLPAFNIASVLACVVLDVFLEKLPSFTAYLQLFVYYFPLLQILTATSQFVGSALLSERCLNEMQQHLIANPEVSSVALMNDYNTLYAATTLISDAFSVQNLFAIGSHGLAFALTSYILTIAGLNYFPPTMAPKKIWLSLVMAAFHFLYALFIFTPCQRLENKGMRYLETLHDRIPTDSLESHILHRPILKKIRFNACDFFEINFNSLGTIITTLITYQVILLQFAQAENDI